MLAGLRISDIGEHLVAHMRSDTIALNEFGAAAIVGADDRT
jgi:hypothetical protein